MITEKMYTEKTYKEFYSRGFPMGRMISQSKSGYRDRHPQHDVMFNANIIIEGANKAWFGDLDITIDRPLLEEIAKALDKCEEREKIVNWDNLKKYVKERYCTDDERAKKYIKRARELTRYQLA